MTRKKTFDPTLYAIADSSVMTDLSAPALVERAIAGGVTAVQIRAKDLAEDEFVDFVRAVMEVTSELGVAAIVNDRADLALRLGADGAHVGAGDIPISKARRMLGADAVVGATAHSLDEVRAATEAGATYIGFGSVYHSPTKKVPSVQGLDGVREARKATRLPLVAIGGITVERAREVVAAGADGVAVISGLWSAEDVAARAREYIEAIEWGRSGR